MPQAANDTDMAIRLAYPRPEDNLQYLGIQKAPACLFSYLSINPEHS